jgi:phosphohistidine phosphatase
MKTLYLLRHAKSSWAEAGARDRDRRLAPRGERAAALLGVYLAQESLAPELVLCSSARRAQETLEPVLAHLSPRPRVSSEDSLYGASAAQLLERLRELEDSLGSVLVIAHNPGLEDLAGVLAGAGDVETLERLRRKLPTAGLVELSFEGGSWRALSPRAGTLQRFVTPKDLI